MHIHDSCQKIVVFYEQCMLKMLYDILKELTRVSENFMNSAYLIGIRFYSQVKLQTIQPLFLKQAIGWDLKNWVLTVKSTKKTDIEIKINPLTFWHWQNKTVTQSYMHFVIYPSTI